MKIYKIAQSNIVSSIYLSSEVEYLHHRYDDILEGDLLERIQKYDFWELVDYNIDDIYLEEWDTDEERIEDYIEEIKKNPNYPPVIIDDKSYGSPTIVDGTHRLNALDKLGYKIVKAYVPYIEK